MISYVSRFAQLDPGCDAKQDGSINFPVEGLKERMYEGELRRIEEHLRNGEYVADVRSLRAIYVLLQEVKRLRSACALSQQRKSLTERLSL